MIYILEFLGLDLKIIKFKNRRYLSDYIEI